MGVVLKDHSTRASWTVAYWLRSSPRSFPRTLDLLGSGLPDRLVRVSGAMRAARPGLHCIRAYRGCERAGVTCRERQAG